MILHTALDLLLHTQTIPPLQHAPSHVPTAGVEDLPSFRRSIRAVNQFGDIIFEDSYGEIDDLGEEDLPYDLEEPHLTLEDHTYASAVKFFIVKSVSASNRSNTAFPLYSASGSYSTSPSSQAIIKVSSSILK